MKFICLSFLLSTVLIFSGNPSVNAYAPPMADSTLSLKQQHIVAIAGLAAIGDLPKLSKALENGLTAGLTVNEIKEVLVHLYAYCGFPRSLRGLQTFMAVLDQRQKRGITDTVGKAASAITSQESKYERGKKVLETLSGQAEVGPKRGYAAFSPEIEIFLKEHLFADLFERDVLTYADRELTTISVLTSIGGVEPMLQSHLGLTMRQGFSEKQIKQVFSILEENVGKTQADAGRAVFMKTRSSNN